jgi:hypothetical protein
MRNELHNWLLLMDLKAGNTPFDNPVGTDLSNCGSTQLFIPQAFPQAILPLSRSVASSTV